MIQESSVLAIDAIAGELSKSNILVFPKNNTPLTLAVNAMATAPLVDATIYEIPEISQRRNIEGVVMHDVVMEELVGVIAETVGGSIAIARTVVNPIISDVIDNVERQFESLQEHLEQPLEIIPDVYFEVWNNPILVNMVERYSQTPVSRWKCSFRMPKLAPDELSKIILSGAERLDGDLREVYEPMGADAIEKLYAAIFIEHNAELLDSLFKVKDVDRGKLIMTHMMARQLLSEVPAGVNAELTEYRETMSSLVAQTGRMILRVMDERTRQNKQGTLVKKYPALTEDMLATRRGTIIVNGDLYNNWLDKGGEPEVIFGAFLSSQHVKGEMLLAGADSYKTRWGRYNRLNESRLRLQRKNNTITALQRAVTSAINELDETNLAVPREVMHETLRTLIVLMHKGRVDNVPSAARKLVCRSMFAHTDAEMILDTIDQIKEDDDSLDIREAALLATVDIVANWVAEMISFEVSGVAKV